jgi:uncharacterized OB-fold protein
VFESKYPLELSPVSTNSLGPARWRGKESELRFVGEKCPHCATFIMPPGDVCPDCHQMVKPLIVNLGEGEITAIHVETNFDENSEETSTTIYTAVHLQQNNQDVIAGFFRKADSPLPSIGSLVKVTKITDKEILKPKFFASLAAV